MIVVFRIVDWTLIFDNFVVRPEWIQLRRWFDRYLLFKGVADELAQGDPKPLGTYLCLGLDFSVE